MAKQKMTPRQKMINLMYLVFIAMMALQMSREVLSAFGMVNEKIEATATALAKNNKDISLAQLESKASDDPAKFAVAYKTAKEVNLVTNAFINKINESKSLITQAYKDEEGNMPFETMDKSDVIDNLWFKGDKVSEEGQKFINDINDYKAKITKLIGKDTAFKLVMEKFNKNFDLSNVKDKSGIVKPYLLYHFQGFPAVASLTKLSAMQNDALVMEQDIYNLLLGNKLIEAVSMRNYKAIVIAEKSAYFAGESFKGKVVLGRYDDSTVPTKVVVNGQALDLNKSLDNGQVRLNFNVGGVGEHKINGLFTFIEDGKPVPIPIEGAYVVVPRPNSANISADKMNVVYRGVSNPLTISFAGISNDKVSASGAGLSNNGGGKYTLRPQGGREVTINVTGTLPDGQKVSDSKVFRIKDIPSPRGTIRGELNSKGQKSALLISTVGAKLEDFDFDLNLTVTSFVVQVPGQPSIVVAGNKMNERAKSAIGKAQLGDVVVISDIKVRLEGAGDYTLKKTSPCTFEIM